MKPYQITEVGKFAPLRAFLLNVLEELKRRHECANPERTLAEIERRHAANPMGCKVYLVLDPALLKDETGIEPAIAAMLVTDITVDEIGDRWLHLWLGWIKKGEHAAPMHFGLAKIKEIARGASCAGVTASSGRRGYDRWISQFGFVPRTTVYEMRLGERR